MVIAQTPLTLVPKGAKPPPESVQEVLDSELFSRTQRKSICHADGARAWPAAAKQVRKGFKFKQANLSHVPETQVLSTSHNSCSKLLSKKAGSTSPRATLFNPNITPT